MVFNIYTLMLSSNHVVYINKSHNFKTSRPKAIFSSWQYNGVAAKKKTKMEQRRRRWSIVLCFSAFWILYSEVVLRYFDFGSYNTSQPGSKNRGFIGFAQHPTLTSFLILSIPAVWRAKQKQLLLGQFATMDLDSWMMKFCVLQTYKVVSLTITNKTACDTAFLNARSPTSTDGDRYVTADGMMTFSTYRESTS
ncbi:hypothetical protein QL285_064395 [Trifolium repens]|nr:hypothetical protein QL285_064395 [Trifolium repens]